MPDSATARRLGPFRFCSRLSLTLATGRRARTLKQLAEGLADASEDVVYQHTHRFLQEHQYLVPEPPNDFSFWATHVLQDELLGERLAGVDTVRYDNLAALQAALLKPLEERLRIQGDRGPVPEGREFHFLRSRRFSVPTPHLAANLEEFVEGLKRVTPSSLYLHLYEARLRPPLGVNDFSHWFRTELGEEDLAQAVASLDPYQRTLETLRGEIVALVERRIRRG